jgi:hypothetical protein
MFCTTFQLATSGRPVSPDASDATACRAPRLGGEFCGHGRPGIFPQAISIFLEKQVEPWKTCGKFVKIMKTMVKHGKNM